MAVVLDKIYGGAFWNRFRLVICDPADQARIEAGKAALDKAEVDFLVATKGKISLLHFGAVDHGWIPDHLPQKLQFEKGQALPDFIHSFAGGNNKYGNASLVSNRLKVLIEQHRSESDDWQFFPIEILHKNGSPYETYYAWCVSRVLDCIDETSEGIKTVSGPVDGDHNWTYSGERSTERLKLKTSVVAKMNAWTDFRFMAFGYIFVSDALFEAMTNAEMSGFAAQSTWSEGLDPS